MSTQNRKRAVGFVGLGQMGGPMAENVMKQGYPLVAYDIDRDKLDHFVALGAGAASNPADMARRARTVISMVDTTAQAEEVIMGVGGLIETAEEGDVIISMSTIDPMALKRMEPRVSAKGIDLLDAPVTGMVTGAKAGTLKAYVGGNPGALERARPVLEAMTSEITHCGSIGQGITMKLVSSCKSQRI